MTYVNLKSRRSIATPLAAALAVSAMLAAPAPAQMQVPRYQSPLSAPPPQPQFTLPATPAITPNATVVEDVIVRVNDQIIDRSDLERAEQQVMEDSQRMSMSPADLAQAQKDLLRDLIDQQLLLSRGKELDINADSELIRQMDEIRKQHNYDSMEALEKAVRESGESVEDWKAYLKNQIIQHQVVAEEVGRKLILTAAEEQAYYDKHKQEFQQPEQVRLSEILIPTSDSPTDEQIAQAKAKADEVEAKLKAGAKFEDLAKQYSGGPNADIGGDLETDFKRGAMAQVFEDQTFTLPVGGVTTPIRTREGFVLLKITAHQAAGIPPLSAVDDQLKQAIYAEAIRPALRAYLTDLREKAYIDIAPGFIDTGASPKQTKPVFASYTAPEPKKKKVEDKQRIDRAATATPAAPSAVASPSVAAASPSAADTPASAPAAKPAGAPAAVAGAAAPAVPAAPTPSTPAPGFKTVAVASAKKPKKFHREKIRYGQAPRNSLPAAPGETLAAGADQGAGGASMALPPGTAIAPIDQTNVASNEDALDPKPADRRKTRFSDREEAQIKAKPTAKVAKAEEKVVATPTPMTSDQKAAQQAQNAPLGLEGDTATKKKPVKDKNAPKERIEDKPPAPPAAKPDATPIPPKSVRENGEPAVTPPPDPSTLPPVAAPANP